MVELNALRQFLVVARLEHLSRAADELHIAQPSLSRTITRLEGELGAPLFDRSGRLRLNDTGRLYRDHVERALGELEAGRRAVAEATGEGVGAVRLASETFLTLTGPLAAFKRSHPAVDTELHWAPPEDMARRLRAHECDLCIASQPLHAEGLEAAKLFEEHVGAAFPLDHPLASRASVSIDDLADQPFVTARNGHWLRRLLDRLFAAHGLTPRIVCESDEHSAIADLISAGLGVGLVPAFARRSATRAPLAWIPLDDPVSHRTVTLYWAPESHLSTAARLLRSTITEWNWATDGPPPRGR
ncbi:LysR family transcriptional regulator [Streptomyces sp. NPDC087866]|uniref:LysR family transcriptional regulator n=1 Tax=unclassified Streptomyces TaxID=2593676 RepID=UPI002251B1BF|nr:LysR substrate-binding domain-containing protein [Streptomyces sp. NBC_01789]MCX4444852.1 LysR substrate-binding domain-containing protein [Streptomyces sp. NBC_01789]